MAFFGRVRRESSSASSWCRSFSDLPARRGSGSAGRSRRPGPARALPRAPRGRGLRSRFRLDGARREGAGAPRDGVLAVLRPFPGPSGSHRLPVRTPERSEGPLPQLQSLEAGLNGRLPHLRSVT